jgi:hypothetical protein
MKEDGTESSKGSCLRKSAAEVKTMSDTFRDFYYRSRKEAIAVLKRTSSALPSRCG